MQRQSSHGTPHLLFPSFQAAAPAALSKLFLAASLLAGTAYLVLLNAALTWEMWSSRSTELVWRDNMLILSLISARVPSVLLQKTKTTIEKPSSASNPRGARRPRRHSRLKYRLHVAYATFRITSSAIARGTAMTRMAKLSADELSYQRLGGVTTNSSAKDRREY